MDAYRALSQGGLTRDSWGQMVKIQNLCCYGYEIFLKEADGHLAEFELNIDFIKIREICNLTIGLYYIGLAEECLATHSHAHSIQCT